MAFGLPSVLYPILSTKGSVCVYNHQSNTVHLLHMIINLNSQHTPNYAAQQHILGVRETQDSRYLKGK
jgi:hypothetical protein